MLLLVLLLQLVLLLLLLLLLLRPRLLGRRPPLLLLPGRLTGCQACWPVVASHGLHSPCSRSWSVGGGIELLPGPQAVAHHDCSVLIARPRLELN